MYCVTILSSRDAGYLLAKRKVLNDEGKLITLVGGALYDGLAHRAYFSTAAELNEIKENLKPHQAIVGGSYNDEFGDHQVPVGTVKQPPPYGITRTERCLPWATGHPGVMTVDCDGGSIADPMSPRIEVCSPQDRQALMFMMEQVAPGISQSMGVVGESGSCGIYAGDTPLTGYDRFHYHIVVREASDIPRALEAIRVRMFLIGCHWALITSRGTILPRCPVDKALATSCQPIFGRAALGEGLTSRIYPATIIEGEPFDTATIPDLTPQELTDYDQVVNKLKSEVALKSSQLIHDLTEKAILKGAERAGMQVAHFRREFERMQEGRGQLVGQVGVVLNTRQYVSANEILLDREKYHRVGCCDPLDPEYGTGKAMIFTDKAPVVVSQAHGQQVTYDLKHDAEGVAEAIRRDPGAEWVIKIQADMVDDPKEVTAVAEILGVDTADITGDPIRSVVGGTLYGPDDQREYFAGCTYVRDLNKVLMPDGALVSTEAFRNSMGGRTFLMSLSSDGVKPTSDAFKAFTQSQMLHFPKADGSCFKPQLPFGKIITEYDRELVNVYRRLQIPMVQGDGARLLLEHLEKILPEGKDAYILLCWMAALIQYPGVKFKWAPFLQGMEGNGKTFLLDVLEGCIGRQYCSRPDAQDLGSNFTGWLENKILIGIDEMYVRKRWDVIEKVKVWITSQYFDVEAKGVDKRGAEIIANFFTISNHIEGVPIKAATRRFAAFICAQQNEGDLQRDGLTEEYFKALFDWLNDVGLAECHHLLATMPIPDEYNPATLCVRAPRTTSTDTAIEAGRGMVEQRIMEAIEDEQQGFRGGWVSSIKVNGLLKEHDLGKRILPAKLTSIMDELGYVVHPALARQRRPRVNNRIHQEGGQPVLYIHKAHPHAALIDAAAVTETYKNAQGYEDTGVLPMPNVSPPKPDSGLSSGQWK